MVIISDNIIGERLKSLREEKDIMQRDLADMLGVSTSAVSMYEIGERVPKDWVKKRYSEIFNKTIDEIFF